MRGFNEVAGFPKVIGAIDGTLIPFRTPFKNEHLYVCHKGFHAINVMATCNARLLFTNVVAKWHGLTHDSAVFNAMRQAMRQPEKNPETFAWNPGCFRGL